VIAVLAPSSPAGSEPENAPALFVHLDLVGGRVELAGRLHRGTVHRLHDAVATLLLTDCPHWTVDVTGLRGWDRPGLRTLETIRRRALRRGRRMTVVGAPPALRTELLRLHLQQPLHDPQSGGPARPDPVSA
jgi:anti-anti-sigma regulatory factor